MADGYAPAIRQQRGTASWMGTLDRGGMGRLFASLRGMIGGVASKGNRKTPPGFRMAGFLVNAGNHLRSHTLTRAVPSAQRGLTSVFGMGTGVALAVYSPANLGVLLDLVLSSVCSQQP